MRGPGHAWSQRTDTLTLTLSLAEGEGGEKRQRTSETVHLGVRLKEGQGHGRGPAIMNRWEGEIFSDGLAAGGRSADPWEAL